MFKIVKKQERDTKFGFVAHLVQKVKIKANSGGGHIGSAAVAIAKVTGAGALVKSIKHVLSYTCGKFGAFRQK